MSAETSKKWYAEHQDHMRAYRKRPDVAARRRQWEKHAWATRPEVRERKTARMRQLRTGFTPELFAQKLIEQHGRCANTKCGVELTIQNYLKKGPLQTAACADHDHATGQPRGILCSRCNHALGNMRDNIDAIHSLADYAESWKRK